MRTELEKLRRENAIMWKALNRIDGTHMSVVETASHGFQYCRRVAYDAIKEVEELSVRDKS